MADTPVVSGPLPTWYTAAQQTRQYMGGWPPGFALSVGHNSPLDFLANPPSGGMAAESAISARTTQEAAGTHTYPEPDRDLG